MKQTKEMRIRHIPLTLHKKFKYNALLKNMSLNDLSIAYTQKGCKWITTLLNYLLFHAIIG